MLTKARTVDPGFEEGINVKIARRHKQTKWQHNAKDNKETTQTFEKRIHPDKGFLLISGGPRKQSQVNHSKYTFMYNYVLKKRSVIY